MTGLRVVTWNAEGMFVTGSKTRRADRHQALKVVRELDADILFVPEFGNTDKVEPASITALHALGYQTVVYSYAQDKLLGSYGAALLTRLPLASHALHHFANTGRTFIEAHLTIDDGRPLRIIGLHLDDRSEQLRLEQIAQAVEIINRPHVGDTIVLGDFNAMHERSRFAQVARSSVAKGIAEKVPHKLVRSMSQRVSEMAAGTTVRYLLEHTELVDLDGKLRRTISAKQAGLEWAPKLRLAKIDWIFGSSGLVATKYAIYKDIGSDHRPVIADIILKLHKK